jgi:hypothetical protein
LLRNRRLSSTLDLEHVPGHPLCLHAGTLLRAHYSTHRRTNLLPRPLQGRSAAYLELRAGQGAASNRVYLYGSNQSLLVLPILQIFDHSSCDGSLRRRPAMNGVCQRPPVRGRRSCGARSGRYPDILTHTHHRSRIIASRSKNAHARTRPHLMLARDI